MQTASVRLPNGKVVSRQLQPGMSDEAIQAAFLPDYQAAGYSRAGAVERKPKAQLKSYQPTLGEKITNYVAQGLSGLGVDPHHAQRLGGKIFGALDFASPLGNVTMASDSKDAFKRGNLLEGSALGALAMLPGGVSKPARGMFGRGIRAWHGSPHDFDKFDLSKIGTGEGAQAYGHGLYFAENRGVAEQYRDMLKDDDNYMVVGGGSYSPDFLENPNVRVNARRAGEDLQAAIAYARDLLPRASEQARPLVERDLAALESLLSKGGVRKSDGRLYEVNINAKPDDFLDWDAPIGKQGELIDRVAQLDVPLIQAWRQNGALPHVKGETIYRQMSGGLTRGAHDQGLHVGASRLLREQAGLPGMKYLDQGSRGAGNGTRNYVVFDDSLLDIVNKF